MVHPLTTIVFTFLLEDRSTFSVCKCVIVVPVVVNVQKCESEEVVVEKLLSAIARRINKNVSITPVLGSFFAHQHPQRNIHSPSGV